MWYVINVPLMNVIDKFIQFPQMINSQTISFFQRKGKRIRIKKMATAKKMVKEMAMEMA